MKSLLTRQQQPSLRHFRSFSAPLPSDPLLPCCFGMSLRRVSCLFSNFNATFACGNCYPGYPATLLLPFLPARYRRNNPCWKRCQLRNYTCHILMPVLRSLLYSCPALSLCFFPLPFVFCRVYLLSIFVSLSRCTPALIRVPFAPLPLFAAVPGREWIIA